MWEDLSLNGLFARLAALMTLALFPLGAVAILQTKNVVETSVQLSRAVMIDDTDQAASVEREVWERARGATQALAVSVSPTLDDLDRCSALMRAFVDNQSVFSFAGYIDVEGVLTCASNGETQVDLSNTMSFNRSKARNDQAFEVDPLGEAVGESVVMVSNPVRDGDTVLGFVTVSFPHSLTRSLAAKKLGERGFQFVAINGDGTILSSSMDTLADAEVLLPAKEAAGPMVHQTGRSFVGLDQTGADRFFVIRSMIPGEVALVGSWPVDQLDDERLLLPLATPLLMWFGGIAMAFLGLNRLVVRHVFALRSAMRRYALGERDTAPLELERPPNEFKSLETSFNRMVMILSAAEARNETDLQEKTVLLREVHHRVKNNLQLIASIMNMHGRTAQAAETKLLLSRLQRRVRSLAAVHQTLNSTTQMSAVHIKSLIQELVRELTPQAPLGVNALTVDTDVAPISLNQDQAVILSMLASEVLANAMSYARSSADDASFVRIKFQPETDGRVFFSVENSKGNTDRQEHSGGGVGQRLMKAFVAQLEGEETIEETDSTYLYQVSFDVAPLDNPVQN